jgi:hypothetical protein
VIRWSAELVRMTALRNTRLRSLELGTRFVRKFAGLGNFGSSRIIASAAMAVARLVTALGKTSVWSVKRG